MLFCRFPAVVDTFTIALFLLRRIYKGMAGILIVLLVAGFAGDDDLASALSGHCPEVPCGEPVRGSPGRPVRQRHPHLRFQGPPHALRLQDDSRLRQGPLLCLRPCLCRNRKLLSLVFLFSMVQAVLLLCSRKPHHMYVLAEARTPELKKAVLKLIAGVCRYALVPRSASWAPTTSQARRRTCM